MRKITLTVISLCFSCLSFAATPHLANLKGGALEQLSGTWDTLPEGQELCVKDEYFHTITASPDRQKITFRHKKPIEGPNGKLSEYTYKVLYSDEKSITMFLEGETRKLSTGDLAIWVLVLEGQDMYRWRIYGTPADWRNTVIGKRCKP